VHPAPHLPQFVVSKMSKKIAICSATGCVAHT
jgi:hypothetical protein